MTKLEALWASAEHWLELWEKVNSGLPLRMKDINSSQCACCQISPHLSTCLGCPIAEYIGRPSCEGTPYVIVANIVFEYCRSYDYSLVEPLLAAVEAEYVFLVELALSKTAKLPTV